MTRLMTEKELQAFEATRDIEAETLLRQMFAYRLLIQQYKYQKQRNWHHISMK